ncbi:sphingolipid delta(4)-desaturase DES1-like [Xenia sp. Carnegie-2017]|uniref:sphingolipid delta(4)-desaturase DES1-like n=1 Tax=Xenia sp. Carnegie-2017 TaxID=2897299 RepID=UPI001F048222|nr:sphingolipid delta(4)-desaturase DES1-like [Xenia sp. Carnegie-2017]
MGGQVSRKDFEWSYTEEPHATRRKEILKKYPEIKKLMVVDHHFKFQVLSLVILQMIVAYLVGRYANWVMVFVLGYCFGGVVNHALLLAIHEISHSAGFGYSKPWHNRILGMIANIPIAIPVTFSFKKYHLEHHRYQGQDVLDVDIPSEMETKLFTNTFTKLIWVILQPFFYSIRPLFVNPKPPTTMEIVNLVSQAALDIFVINYFGGKALVYLLASSLLGMGLHPVAGHFISEHYMFRKGFETYSYYGPLNMVTFNVGYHNEHHDFPSIPGSLLPKVREIAPEYYDNLPHHTSWVKVLYDYITDPEIGPYSRVKRNQALSNMEDLKMNSKAK